MSEESGSESEVPKPSLSDFLMRQKAKLEKPPNPHQFQNILHPDPTDLSKKDPRQVAERELPIVKEAEKIADRARAKGLLVSEPENPLGEVESALVYVMGDLHLPATNPHQSVESRSPVIRGLVVESGPRSIAGHFKREDWYHVGRPKVAQDAFLQMEEAVVTDIGKRGEYARTGNAVMILDLGDRSYNDVGIADIAGISMSYGHMRQSAEARLREVSGNSEAKVHQAMAKGNHEADIINFQGQAERAERRFHGSQIFYQEIGKEHALLVLNTNFPGDYWKRYYEALKSSSKSEEDLELIDQIEAEIELQKRLIQKALDSGRKLMVAGHQEDQVGRLIDLQNSRVVRILSGHVDPPEKDAELEIKNKDGERIKRTRVGGALGGLPGWELRKTENMEPVSFTIEIKEDASGQEVVNIEQVEIPRAAKELQYLA